MKNLIHLKSAMVFVFLASTVSLFGQKAETPDQNFSLGTKINEMILTVGGVLVVATNDGLGLETNGK